MLHFDYEWDLYPDRIILDAELNTDKLGWQGGDYFRLININGEKMLIKLDPLEKFLLDGQEKKNVRSS